MPDTTMSPTAALSKLQWDKKLLERPEGKIAIAAVAVLVLGLLGVAGLYLLPVITQIAWNLVNAVFALSVAGVVLVSAKPAAKLFWLWNQRFWRKAHEWSVTVDPISAMLEFQGYFQRKLQVVSKSIQAVRSVLAEIKAGFLRTQKEAQDSLGQARALQREGGHDDLVNAATRRANRLSERLAHLQEQMNLCQRFLDFLTKYKSAVDDKYRDVSEQIEEKRQEYEMAMRTQDAVNAMREVFGTGGEAQADFDLALQAIDSSYANTIASMQMLEDEAKDVMTAIQIDDIMIRQSGSQKLDELERKLQSGIFTAPGVRVANDTAQATGTDGAGYQTGVRVEDGNDLLDDLFPGTTTKTRAQK